MHRLHSYASDSIQFHLFQACDEFINWLVDDTCFEYLTITNIYVFGFQLVLSVVRITQKWLGTSCGPKCCAFDWFLYSYCMFNFQSFTHFICCITMIQQIDNNSLVEKYTWNVNQFNWRKWFVWQSQWWYILGINV